MCAIIGIYAPDASGLTMEFVRKIFLESSIRGLHATGVSYLKGGKVDTISLPVPADSFPFPENLEDWKEGNSLFLIGHCRYSTSDLEYNQPVVGENSALVHNGVVTQEPPELWNIECKGKNDSELLARMIEQDISPHEVYPEASAAWVRLTPETIQVCRNGKRPAYMSQYNGAIVITSTLDIALRSGLGYNRVVQPHLIYDLKKGTTASNGDPSPDLQI